MIRLSAFAILLAVLVSASSAFDNDELEIFDLVEEVDRNFYDFLELDSGAGTNEVRKAYRRLSLVLHPDKNDADDAAVQFRWLASIYEVLKDPKKREIYDRVLVEGLPDWRSPVFYYRRMRKIGLAEGVAYILAIATFVQYFVNLAAYWEKRYTLKEAINNQMGKKSMRKATKAMSDEEIREMVAEQESKVLGPKPSVYDTLPFQLFRAAKFSVLAVPGLPGKAFARYKSYREERENTLRSEREREAEMRKRDEEKREKKERMRERKRANELYEEKDIAPDVVRNPDPEPGRSRYSTRPWTDDDLARLVKLIKKYPAGTPDRWDRIADILEMPPSEITRMTKKLKEGAYTVPISKGAQGITGLESNKLVADDRLGDNFAAASSSSSGEEMSSSDDENYGVYTVAKNVESAVADVKTKVKTKGGKNDPSSDEPSVWSNQQQKALESALVQFPKGTAERWDRISGKVPGKSRDQCVARFRELAEQVRKKREEAKQDPVASCEPEIASS